MTKEQGIIRQLVWVKHPNNPLVQQAASAYGLFTVSGGRWTLISETLRPVLECRDDEAAKAAAQAYFEALVRAHLALDPSDRNTGR